MNQNPKVTVLMSVYNGERFLREAIESILHQTFTDFEFLIINDGSTDQSRDIILSYQDPRIRLIDNDCNIGLTKSLNKGIDLARGEYIARMDADDVSLPERLEKQYQFITRHTDYAVIGGCGAWMDEQSMVTGDIQMLCEFDDLLRHIFWGNILMHPSVFMEKGVVTIVGKYDDTFIYAQDYDLWFRILAQKKKFYNLPDCLLHYRVHQNAISTDASQTQDHFAALAVQRGIYRIFQRHVPLATIILIRKLYCALTKETVSIRQKLAIIVFLRMFTRCFKKAYACYPVAIQKITQESQRIIWHLTANPWLQSFLMH